MGDVSAYGEQLVERRVKSLPSMLSRFNDTMSMRSMFGKLQKRPLVAEPTSGPQLKMRWRDWLLTFAELCMSFSWASFMTRAQSERTLKMRQMTPRDELVQRLLCNGLAGFGNLLMGQLADGYTRNYGIVLINVTGHFTLSSLFFMSEVVNETASEDEYGLLLSDIFVWLYIPIRATDFARIVYGLEQLEGKNNALVLFFAFIFQLADLCGGFLFLVLNSSDVPFQMVTFIAFTANGIVLFLFAYVLVPQDTAYHQFERGLVVRLWGCVITALSNKRKSQRTKKNSWLDYADTKYEKSHVMKAKKLLKLFLLILPAVGFLLFTGLNEDIFRIFWTGLNHSGRQNIYMIWAVNSATLLTMLFFELVAIPVISFMGFTVNFYRRFIIGFMALLFAVFFATLTAQFTEKLYIGRDVALSRFFNTLKVPVNMSSYDTKYSSLNYSVPGGSALVVNYQTKKPRLLRMNVQFLDQRDFVIQVSLEPYAMTGYVFVEPSDAYRITGKIPVLEAPPGQNNWMMPRIFVVNLISEQSVQLAVVNLVTGYTNSLEVATGSMEIFQVMEGEYLFQVVNTIAKVEYTVLIGGVYGIYIYLDLEEYRINVDKVIPENTTPPLLGLGISAPMGIAKGIGSVALVTFVFTNSPDGLKGIALGYLFFLSQVSSWVLLIGFYTWHPHITSFALVLYLLMTTCLFVVSLVLIIRYRKLYKL